MRAWVKIFVLRGKPMVSMNEVENVPKVEEMDVLVDSEPVPDTRMCPSKERHHIPPHSRNSLDLCWYTITPLHPPLRLPHPRVGPPQILAFIHDRNRHIQSIALAHPYAILQDALTIHIRFRERDHIVFDRRPDRGSDRGVQTEGLADDGVEQRELVERGEVGGVERRGAGGGGGEREAAAFGAEGGLEGGVLGGAELEEDPGHEGRGGFVPCEDEGGDLCRHDVT
jgi:hypothetical protein